MITKQDLFEARKNGYYTCRIPGIIATANDTVLVTGEARPGKGGDYDYNDVLMRRSTDGGRTFEPFFKLVDHADYGDGPISNFIMIPDQASGRIVAVFCHDYATVYTLHSDDEGVTWSTPREITDVFDRFKDDYPWRVCATGPGHGTQLRNGRIIIPVWLSDGSGSDFGPNHRGHRPSIVSLITSDDGGATWERGEIVCRNGEIVEGVEVCNPSETVAVELTDGRVLFNLRSESMNNRRLVAVSPDGVTGWEIRGFDPVVREPVCMAALIRHSWPADDEPGRILFTNPDTLGTDMRYWIDPTEKPHRNRENLTVRLSLDDSQTWSHSRVLEPGHAGYSDLAVLSTGEILCLYECDIVERIHDDRYLRLARFDINWITEGDD